MLVAFRQRCISLLPPFPSSSSFIIFGQCQRVQQQQQQQSRSSVCVWLILHPAHAAANWILPSIFFPSDANRSIRRKLCDPGQNPRGTHTHIHVVRPSIRPSLSPRQLNSPPQKTGAECIKRSSGDGGVGGELHTQIQKRREPFCTLPKMADFSSGFFYFYYIFRNMKKFREPVWLVSSKGLICPCVIWEKMASSTQKRPRGSCVCVCLEVFSKKLIRPV